MTRLLNIRPAAANDIDVAYRWYERQKEGLGKTFLDALERSFERIKVKPELYSYVLRDARRALIPGFPYSVFFRVVGDEIRIFGVIHQHRHSKH